MRFEADGPSIPDALLAARDEGAVVFFCGAGVSRARVGLPGFAGLAKSVLDDLGSAKDSLARQLLNITASQEAIPGIGSLLPTDRVFSLLEREFSPEEVRLSVAKALRYADDADCSAHKTLSVLATGPDRRVRLVTTNFDRLFESAAEGLERYVPPMLPRPNRPEEWSGIVYLHGRLGDNFCAPPPQEEFVLSSSDFGRAYLADGWATSFIRGLIEQFQIVFVGYSADDPPVHYLLEALRGKATRGLYAFQSGTADHARSLWESKGVQAIPYDSSAGHEPLWRTLDQWALRARDPSAWVEEVINNARRGPSALAPFERGQVRHVVSSSAGAKAFALSRAPAEWLCVFDASMRYATPSQSLEETGVWDPFEQYHLDDDPIPERTDVEKPYKQRDRPEDAWDGFRITPEDLPSDSSRFLSSFRGHAAGAVSSLPPRLHFLGVWLSNTWNEPTSAWWAAGQSALHPDVLDLVRRTIRQSGRKTSSSEAWELIFAASEEAPADHDLSLFDLEAEVKAGGWNITRVRRLAKLLLPRITVSRPYTLGPPLAEDTETVDRGNIVNGDVQYPSEADFVLPGDEHAILLTAELRRGLDIALELEQAARGYLYLNVPSLVPDPDVKGTEFNRDYGIARPFFRYLKTFESLIAANDTAALTEASLWPGSYLFERLRIWIGYGWPSYPDGLFAKHVVALSDEAFWGGDSQRDLLLALGARWKSFSKQDRSAIVRRLLRGPAQHQDEPTTDYRQRHAYRILERSEWLHNAGHSLGNDYTRRRSGLIKSAGDWWEDLQPDKAVRTREGRGGFIGTDPNADSIEEVPLRQVIDAAEAAGGRDWEKLVDRRPFVGLSHSRPMKAFKALMLASLAGDPPRWAWDDFFNHEDRKKDSDRFRCVIARRLCQLSTQTIRAHIRIITRWLEQSASSMTASNAGVFWDLWDYVVAAVREDPTCSQPSVSKTGRLDWVMLALNSAGGELAQALMNDEGKQNSEGFSGDWLQRATQLLSIGGDVRREAATIFLRNLSWFHYWNSAWAEENLVALSAGSQDDRDAFWSGLLSSSRPPPGPIFEQIKTDLIELAKSGIDTHRIERAAAFLLLGWIGRKGRKPYLSDDELREVLASSTEEFRLQTLFTLRRWASESPAWMKRFYKILEHIWPQQRLARSPKVSARLVDIAFESDRSFARMVDAIEPLIGPVDSGSWSLYKLSKPNSLLTRQPKLALRLLHKALPVDASTWPYGADSAVMQLASVPEVSTDSRMVELRRRLNARPY